MLKAPISNIRQRFDPDSSVYPIADFQRDGYLLFTPFHVKVGHRLLPRTPGVATSLDRTDTEAHLKDLGAIKKYLVLRYLRSKREYGKHHLVCDHSPRWKMFNTELTPGNESLPGHDKTIT